MSALLIALFSCTVVLTDPGTPGETDPPAVPLGLAAQPGDAQVVLSWNATSGATSYVLYRSLSSPVASASATRILGVHSPYADTGLTNGLTYYYAVAAINAGGESGVSTTVDATPQVPAIGPPTVLAATGGVSQVTVSWNAVAGATGYNLYWSTSPGFSTGEGTLISGASSPYVHTGLTGGTTYYYLVTSIDGSGVESAASGQIQATTTSVTLVSFTQAGFTSNGWGASGDGGSAKFTTTEGGVLNFVGVHTGGTGYFEVYTMPDSSLAVSGSVPASQANFRMTAFGSGTLQLNSFRVYNPSAMSATLTVQGWLTPEQSSWPDLPVTGYITSQVVTANPSGWTAINLSPGLFSGVYEVTIDFVDGTELYFNDFSVQ